MSRSLSLPGRALALLSAAVFTLGLIACGEDGKTAPERCADPPLPIFDIQSAGAPADDNARYNDAGELPCVTEVGHGVSGPAGDDSSSGGSDGGNSPADAGAGGA